MKNKTDQIRVNAAGCRPIAAQKSSKTGGGQEL